jgi:hypothetical protein
VRVWHSSTSATKCYDLLCMPLALAVGGARPLTLGNEPDDRQQQPLVRRASVALAAASPDTWDDQRDARLAHCTRAASAGAVAPARVLRRPDSRDEFELALGKAMTALQLGNCDLARLPARGDGGVAARLCSPALARWRPVHAKRTTPSATTRRAWRPDEADATRARRRDVRVRVALGRTCRLSLIACAKHCEE